MPGRRHMKNSLPEFRYRPANPADVPELARIRAAVWETEEYWRHRIDGYLDGVMNPQQALSPRAIFVATIYPAGKSESPIGFVAGHLTRRHSCDGELQWIDVVESYRGHGIASALLRQMAAWFLDQNAKRICVDVAPQNLVARSLYAQHGATELNKHWMVWEDIRAALAK